jgi:tetratricopeptide (TPR) repeat protein
MAIGTADITIKAVVKGFKSEIRAALKDLGTAPENAGKRAGKEFVDGFKETSGQRIFAETKKQLREQEIVLSAYAKKIGRKVGKNFADGFRETSGLNLFKEARKKIAEGPLALGPEAYISGSLVGAEFSDGFRNTAGKHLFDEVHKELKDFTRTHDRFNRSVGKGGGFSKLKMEAEAARKAFNKLIKAGYLIGPAIAGAVSAIGDLIFGLFSVGSAVGAAAPALAVLPGLLAAIAQGALTAKLAFGGVGKAVGAILKQKTGKGGDSGAADSAIADARKRLAMAYQSAAEKMAAANDKVRKAQISLNQAYKDGAESLQQLGFDAEDAALAQSKAAIELERARESLLRTQDVPVDSRARREAELAFKEAELNYRKSVDKSNDLKKAQDYAAKTGIEGTKEVISAKQDLNEAEADRAKTERDNAQDILEAQQALQKALQKTNKSSSDSVDLLKDLSAEAKRFVLYITTLKPAFLDLKAAAGKELFGPLTIAVQMIVNKLFPVLKPMLTAMGGVIGQLAQRFAEMLTRVGNLDIFKRVFGGANIKIMQNLGHAFVDIAEAALNILDAVSPLTTQFSAFVRKVADNLVGVVRYKNATGELAEKFQRAAEIAKRIGALFSSAFSAFKSFGGAATEAGVKIIDAFTGAFEKLKAFSDEGRRTGELNKKFDAIADNFIAIGALLGEIGKALFAVSGSAGVKAFLEGVKPIPMMFADMANKLTTTGSIFAELLVNATKLLSAFTETGGMTIFFGILNQILKVLVAIFSDPLINKIFTFLAAIKGLTLAFGVLVTASRFFGLVTLGNILLTGGLSKKLLEMSGSARTAAGSLRKMNMAGGPGAKLGETFTRVRRSLVVLGGELKKTAVLMIQNSISAVRNGISWLFSTASLKAFGRAMKFATVGVYQMTKALILQAAAFAMTPVGAVVIAIGALIAIFVLAYKNSEKLRKAIDSMGRAIMGSLKEAFSTIQDAIKSILPSFTNFGDTMKKVGDWIADNLVPAFTKLIQFGIKIFTSYLMVLIGVFKIVFSWFKMIFDLIFAFPMSIYRSMTTGEDMITALINVIKDAFYSFVNGVISGVNVLIKAFNVLSPKDLPLIPLLEKSKTATDKLKESSDKLKEKQQKVREAMERQKEAAANLYKEFGSLVDIQAKVRQAMEDSFDKVTSAARALIDARHATKEFKDAQSTLVTAIKDSTLTLTQKKDALYDFAGATLDAAKKNIELGKSSASTKKIITDGRTAFLKQAAAINMPTRAAEKLADALGLTPNTVKKAFEVTGLDNLQKGIDKLKELSGAAYGIGGEEFNKRVAEYMKKHAVGIMQATAKVSKILGAEKTALEANINNVMTVNFGKGQKEGDPLFVEVTNADEVGGGKGKGKGKDGKYSGGQVKGGSTYLVGERGPELFQAPTSGNIIPNHQVGTGNTINLTVNPSPGMDEREIASLVSRRLAFMQRGA